MNRYERVRQWARDRNLIEGSTPAKQYLKLIEELGEVAGALARGNRDALMDGIGDVAVVLIIRAEMKGVDCGEHVLPLVPGAHLSNVAEAVVLLPVSIAMGRLKMFAKAEGLDFGECLDRAWDDIKDRRGFLINQVFVKESDIDYKIDRWLGGEQDIGLPEYLGMTDAEYASYVGGKIGKGEA